MRRILIEEKEKEAPSEETERLVAVSLAIWLFVSVMLSALGLLRLFPTPFPQVLMLALFTAALFLINLNNKVYLWLTIIPVQTLVAVHLVRFLGIYFLIAPAISKLPKEFGHLAGWYELLLAWAVVILLTWKAKLNVQFYWKILLFWNLLGIGEILIFLITSFMLALNNPEGASELTGLPLSLYFLFIIPVLGLSHLIIMVRFYKLLTEG